MRGACPYVVVLRLTAQEHDATLRERRPGELPGDVIRRRLGWEPEHALAAAENERQVRIPVRAA